jgi:hypothetical protein
VNVAVKKMDYVFTKQLPIDEEFVGYLDCLTEAHNQMLIQIQDPNNKFMAMEVNPVQSKDDNHGLPALYNEILNAILKQVELLEQAEKEEFDE